MTWPLRNAEVLTSTIPRASRGWGMTEPGLWGAEDWVGLLLEEAGFGGAENPVSQDD